MQVVEKKRLEEKLLALWNRHPEAKFTLDTIVYCLDRRKQEIRRALLTLEQAGLLRKEYKGDIAFYSLTCQRNGGKIQGVQR